MQYIIVHKLKLAFADVAKCGSCSLKELAYFHDYPDHSYFLHPEFNYFFSHLHQVEINKGISTKCSDEDIPSGYRKILFVRNPFSRIVSSYNHFRNLENYAQSDIHRLMKIITFEDFVCNHLLNLSRVDCHFVPMKRRLRVCDDDVEVYRFENFQEEISKLVPGYDLLHLNKTSSFQDSYKLMYNIKTKIIVSSIFCWDCSNLGYSFDGYSGNLPDLKELKASIALKDNRPRRGVGIDDRPVLRL